MSFEAELVSSYKAAHRRLWGGQTKQAPEIVLTRPDAPAPPRPRITWVSPPRPEVKRLQVRHIQEAVAEAYGIKLADLLGPRRFGPIVLARQVAMYLAKQLLGISQPDIGRRFGGKDHTTVLHAVRKIGLMADCDEGVKAHLAELVAILRQKFPLAFEAKVERAE